jgi:hypothetical protein
MINYVTGYNYSGYNADVLAAAGVEAVVTFKQATRELGIPGKALKGLKACAKLMRLTKDEDEVGKKKVTFYSVFDVEEVLARKGK